MRRLSCPPARPAVSDTACAASFTLRLGLGATSGFRRPLRPGAWPQDEFPVSTEDCVLRFSQQPNFRLAPVVRSSSLAGDQPPTPSKPGSLSSTSGEPPTFIGCCTLNLSLASKHPACAACPSTCRACDELPVSTGRCIAGKADDEYPTSTFHCISGSASDQSSACAAFRLSGSALHRSPTLIGVRFPARPDVELPACTVCFSSCRSGCQLPIRYRIISCCEATTVQSVNASANRRIPCGFHQAWCNRFRYAAFLMHSCESGPIFPANRRGKGRLHTNGSCAAWLWLWTCAFSPMRARVWRMCLKKGKVSCRQALKRRG